MAVSPTIRRPTPDGLPRPGARRNGLLSPSPSGPGCFRVTSPAPPPSGPLSSRPSCFQTSARLRTPPVLTLPVESTPARTIEAAGRPGIRSSLGAAPTAGPLFDPGVHLGAGPRTHGPRITTETCPNPSVEGLVIVSRIQAIQPTNGAKTAVAAAVLSIMLLAGCANGPSSPHSGGAAAEAGGTQSETPSPAAVAAAAEGSPSAAAKMVCGDETRANITRILSLPASPPTSDSWAEKLYTCTYSLPSGPLVLSVRETADPAAARARFDSLQRQPTARPIEGMTNLGLPGFETTAGSVVFAKDNFVLTVDATALPPTLGPHSVSRNAFAYETATGVLACWSE